MRRVLVALAILLVLMVLLGTMAWFMMGPGTAPPELRGPDDETVAVPGEDERGPRERLRRAGGAVAPEKQPAPAAPTGVAPPPREYRHVRATVIDGNRAVVEGALVQVTAMQTRLALAGEPVVLTDALGEARVRIWTGDGMFRVLAVRGDDRAQSELLFPPDDGDLSIELRLAPAVIVRGRVVDADGRALAMTQVLCRTSEVTVDEFIYGARCDNAGKFQLPAIAANEVANGATITAVAERGRAPLTEHFDSVSLRSGRILLRVSDRVRGIGRVLTPDLQPAAGVTVQLDGGPYGANTGHDGRFEFSFVTTDRARVVVIPGADHAVMTASLPEPTGGVCDAGDILLSSGRSLELRVRAADGVPVATGTAVHVIEAGLTVHATVTTGDGVAVVHGLGSGPFDIVALGAFGTVSNQASVPHGHAPLQIGTARGVTPDDTGVEIVMRGGRSIALRFIDEVSRRPLEPLRGVLKLRLERPNHIGRVRLWPDYVGSGPPRFVTADFPGPHELIVTAAGYHTAVVHDVEIHDDRITDVEVPLRAR